METFAFQKQNQVCLECQQAILRGILCKSCQKFNILSTKFVDFHAVTEDIELRKVRQQMSAGRITLRMGLFTFGLIRGLYVIRKHSRLARSNNQDDNKQKSFAVNRLP